MVLNIWILRAMVQCQPVQRQHTPVCCNHFRCKISLRWLAWANRRLAQLRLVNVNHFLALNLAQPQHLYVRSMLNVFFLFLSSLHFIGAYLFFFCKPIHFDNLFRVSTRLYNCCVASIHTQWIVCSIANHGECFEYDCITRCREANRR